MHQIEYADSSRRSLQDPETRLRWLLGALDGENRPDQVAILERQIGMTEARLVRPPEFRRAPTVTSPARPVNTSPGPSPPARRIPAPEPEPVRTVTDLDRKLITVLGMDEERTLTTLRADWLNISYRFFKNTLPACTIRLDRQKGQIASCGGIGRGKPEIFLNPDILLGEYRVHCEGGNKDKVGLLRAAHDTLIHEALHFFLGEPGLEWGGHACTFHAEAMRISQDYFFGPLKRSWREKLTLEKCKEWPFSVRPKSYYNGAFSW